MGTEELDIDGILSLTNVRMNDYSQAPEGLRIGHMHLRVGDLEPATAFYRDAVGFALTRQRDGAAFLSSGGYHHHVGMNVWRSAGAGKRGGKPTGDQQAASLTGLRGLGSRDRHVARLRLHYPCLIGA